jgi:hypothetical protein
MADPVWEVTIDTAGDGSYSTDVSSDTIECWWELGFRQPYQPVSMPDRAVFVLRNTDGRYSPEHGSATAGFTVGRKIRVRSTYSSTTRTHMIMWITSIRPAPGARGPRTTQVECEGYMARCQRVRTVPAETQIAKRVDEVIPSVLSATGAYPPAGSGAGGYDLDVGEEIFAYVLDNAPSSLYGLWQQLALSEGYPARIFVARDGRLTFWNRSSFAETDDVSSTLAGTMIDLDYGYGEFVANAITVTHNPRKLETGVATLATLGSAIRVDAGATVTIQMRYDDGSGNRISTTSAIEPASSTDYTAHTGPDGTGTDLTASFTVTASHYAQYSEWGIENTGGVDGYLDAGATQRGNNVLTDFGRVDVVREDSASQTAYGYLEWDVNAGLLNSDTADSLAAYLLALFKDPRGEARAVTIRPRSSATLLAAALARVMGERITVTETQTGEDADYYIIGERHALRQGGADYAVVWTLEPAGPWDGFWLLGVAGRSELGVATILGY